MDHFRFGRGDKTMVILPGLSVQSVINYADAIAEAYTSLADEFTVYVFDRRRELPAAYSVHDMAVDTIAAFETLALTDIYLFGASQGGMIAMEIAIRRPDLVRKLILGSTAACVTETRSKTVADWIALAKAGNAAGLCAAFGKAVYPQGVFEQVRDVLAESAKSVTRSELDRFVILAQGMYGFDIVEDLKKIACPVLAIGAADDRVLGADATGQIAAQMQGRSDFEVYMYDGFGHAAYDTAPDYKKRILHFFLQ